MKQIVLQLYIGINVLQLYSQTELNWGISIGSKSTDYISNAVVMADNSVIQLMYPGDTIDVDPGPKIKKFNGPWDKNVLLNFFNDKGEYVKTLHFHDTSRVNIDLMGLDKQGRMIITGFHKSTLFMNTNNTTKILGSPNTKNAFIARISTTGDIDWITEFEYTESIFGANKFLEDASGSYILYGTFGGTVKHVSSNSTFTSEGKNDCFIFKLSANGQFLRGASMGSVKYDALAGLKFLKNGGYIYTITTSEDFNFKSTNGNVTIRSTYKKNYFIFGKMNEKFEIESYFTTEATSGVGANNLTIDNNENIYVAGFFEGSVNFDPMKNSKYTYSALKGGDGFIVKYTIDGKIQWVNDYRISNYGQINNIEFKNNSLYCTGDYAVQIDLDPGPGELLLKDNNEGTSFFFKTDLSGQLLWHNEFPSQIDLAGIHTISFGSGNNIYLSGFFYGNIDCDPGSDSMWLRNTSHLGTDVFLISLHEKNVTSNTLNEKTNRENPKVQMALDELHISHVENLLNVKIIDLQGRTIQVYENIESQYLSIPIQSLINGAYIINIRSKSKQNTTNHYCVKFIR